jgi:hypothetical protein
MLEKEFFFEEKKNSFFGLKKENSFEISDGLFFTDSQFCLADREILV